MRVRSLCLMISTPFYCVHRAEKAVVDMQTQPRVGRSLRSNTHRPCRSRKLPIFPDMITFTAAPLFSDGVSDPHHTLLHPPALPCHLRRVPQPRHLQPGPHHRPRQRADTLPPAVHETERELFDGGFYGYDVYDRVRLQPLCRAVRVTISRVVERVKRGGEEEKGQGKKKKTKKNGRRRRRRRGGEMYPIAY